ncbi:MAG: hypothetical protein HKN72_04640 [Gemmatimonadetes bacterium]|nr:hypothetical protein [Gemmatimonadota bacterium]
MARNPRVRRSAALVFFTGVMMACAPIALAGPDCAPVRRGVPLPAAVDESSGVAVGLRQPSVLWTHNDDGSTLFALDSTGALLDSRPVRPRLRDWEDLAVARCEAHGSCVYMADTGDNAERRRPGTIRVLRIAEPGPSANSVLRGEVFPLRLPDGPRDIEAMFVLPDERLYLVTKGRNHAVTVYRYPGPLRPDTVTMEEVQRLGDGARPLADQVTGASALSDGGDVVAIRTYQSMVFYRMEGDTLAPLADGLVNLRTLEESQGEAVALGPGGLVVLTSEAGFFGSLGSMNLLRCRP